MRAIELAFIEAARKADAKKTSVKVAQVTIGALRRSEFNRKRWEEEKGRRDVAKNAKAPD